MLYTKQQYINHDLWWLDTQALDVTAIVGDCQLSTVKRALHITLVSDCQLSKRALVSPRSHVPLRRESGNEASTHVMKVELSLSYTFVYMV